MTESYRVPDLAAGEMHRREEVIRGSRFIVSMAHCDSPEAAYAFLEKIRAEHAHATHNCWAFQAGRPGTTAHIGASDDGEPKGTAGRPMLTVLLHCGVGEVAAVVTRYFGGTLLGTGGLVRAYQDSVRENLQNLPQAERVPSLALTVSLAYAHVDKVRRLLPDFEAVVLAEDYGAEANLRLRLPEARQALFVEAVAARTDGRAVCRIEDEA